MMIDSSNVYAVVKGNAPDEVVDSTIAQFLTSWNIPGTVQEWKIENYAQLREWAYPSSTEFNDAFVKTRSGDPDLVAEGEIQMDKYVKDCMAVKERFPKN